MTKSLRTRLWPRQCSTRSWQAAYNLACAYAAIAADRTRTLQACKHKAEDAQTAAEAKRIHDLVANVITSLEFAVSNPECEMERPWEWIAHDPDFGCLRSTDDEFSMEFRSFLTTQKKRDYPSRTTGDPLQKGWHVLSDVIHR